MEQAGPEKRIQELFHELKLADQQITPGFTRVMSRAQSERPRRVFRFSLAAVAAVLVIAVIALGLWSRNRQGEQQASPAIAAGPAETTPVPVANVSPAPQDQKAVEPPRRIVLSAAARKLAVRRHAELLARKAMVREAAVISSWQSPTATLLQSPADDVLTTLPQLNQPVNELKSFLPNTPK